MFRVIHPYAFGCMGVDTHTGKPSRNAECSVLLCGGALKLPAPGAYPYSPELQPAEHLWPVLDEPPVMFGKAN
jgi:hypothetical protein